MEIKTVEKLRTRLEGWIRVSRKHLAVFQKDLEDAPAKALEWSRDMFLHAAREEVARKLLEAVNNETRDPAFTVQDARDWLQEEVITAASYAEQSTSIQGNVMDRQRLAAKSKLLYELSGGMSF